MATTVGAIIPPGTLRDAAQHSQLPGASKSQVLRYAMLLVVMDAQDARAAVFDTSSDLTETAGRVDAFVPEHELLEIQDAMTELDFKEISAFARYALAKAAGKTDKNARAFAFATRRGRPGKTSRAVT